MTRFGNSNFITVSFFGHRYIDDMIFVEQKLEDIIKGFIRDFYYVNFLVGRNGDFDQLVSSSIISSKKTNLQSKLLSYLGITLPNFGFNRKPNVLQCILRFN